MSFRLSEQEENAGPQPLASAGAMSDAAPDRALLALLAQGYERVALHGCPHSYLALLLARLARSGELVRPVVVVTAEEDVAHELARDVGFFLGAGEEPGAADDRSAARGHLAAELSPVMHLPQLESSPYAEISPDRATIMNRLAVLFRLSQGFAGPLLLASAAALRRRAIPPAELDRLCDLIAVEEEIGRDRLVEKLVACGFGRVQVVEDPGTFAVRGGIVDCFPPLQRFPARIELFGDWVEKIRLFDPASQRTLRAVDELYLHPVRETIPTAGASLRAAILRAADEVNHPSSRTRTLLDELESGRELFGVEALTPAFHERMASLADYLPERALWVLHDPEAIQHVLAAEDARSEAAWQSRREQSRLAFPPSDFFVGEEELRAEIARHPRIEVRVTAAEPGTAELSCAVRDNADLVAELAQARRDHGEEILDHLAGRLRRWEQEGQHVLVAAGPLAQVERLDALLRGRGLRPRVERQPGTPDLLEASVRRAPGVQLRPGVLGSGFRTADGLVVLVEEEIFGPKARRWAPRRLAGPGLGDLRELQPADHVVHAEHGVGRYLGLVKLAIRGVPADFMLIEYAAGDRLYLPVYRMNLVQKYAGAEAAEVKLDRLGGVTWARKKGKVRAEVRRMAEELLQLYAQRAALQGHAFPPGDTFYTEFEATFPFNETPDQYEAVQQVLADMTAARPMDRLVCGDVGFGKTEVALRAAFLAAVSGKQVAVLAPTTVLVEQHHRTFSDRVGLFPLRVEHVSRFRSRKELGAVLTDLAQGRVDIVIGTHRLLSSDVRFKDLGLLIIDEEQRFGVAHKERLKRLRTQVDVLTLTATPIPRTLQLSMVGLREISIIATPPVDRLAIRTFVCRYDDAVVAEAIRKELGRGGQVFFVHNRVESIAEWAQRIAGLVPEARVAIAHGQMDSHRLEGVMVDFVSGRYDVLVCTAIIESGLDIPRANTMFINRADCFGLAQLYQLRGRIGRSRHRAFCYLLVPGIEAMSGDARQRLAALQRFTELGSGFSVASHDLEIRGSGELLGARQSGQIAAVGFETYARILQEAVAELRGEPITRESDPELNTCVAAFIPDDYVEDAGQRLDLYRRLSQAAADEEAVHDILSEIRDRYGPGPVEVDALGELMIVKGLASVLSATVVDVSERKLILTLGEQTPLARERVVELVSRRGSLYRVTPEGRLVRSLAEDEQRRPLEAARKILHELAAYAIQTH